jgi:hypothetical protein
LLRARPQTHDLARGRVAHRPAGWHRNLPGSCRSYSHPKNAPETSF